MHRFAVLLSLASTVFGAAPVANTTSGPVAGTSDGSVNQWLGIPFAQSPPVRFGAPIDAKPWSAPLQATAYKPSCIQYRSNSPGGTDGAAESEDCLYLNIWAPTKPAPSGGWPVMFWIYGGDLVDGAGSVPGYNGSNLANTRDVIIVTHNYRLNVFGFPNSPNLPDNEGNPGFLDQRKALDWTSRNIANFGGNPAQVTIFGESAGGWSVKQLVAQPPSPLNFRAAILESEAVSEKNGPQGWAKLTAALNCPYGAQQLECMRSKSVQQIKTTMVSQRLGFSPVNDKTSATNVAPFFRDGKAARVPIIIGTNANEGTLFSQGGGAYAAEYVTNFSFLCPVSLLARLMIESGLPSVHRYYFNTSFPQFAPFAGAGVYHGIEIGPLFGNFYTTAQAQAFAPVSDAIQTAWTNFAKDPMASPGWQGYSRESKPVYIFNPQGSKEVIQAPQLDKPCAALDEIVKVTGLKA